MLWDANVCFSASREAVVTAWQAGCESLLTGRSVPQLVDAEENRTSCQPSGRHPTFAQRLAVTLRLLRIPRSELYLPRVDICSRLDVVSVFSPRIR